MKAGGAFSNEKAPPDPPKEECRLPLPSSLGERVNLVTVDCQSDEALAEEALTSEPRERGAALARK